MGKVDTSGIWTHASLDDTSLFTEWGKDHIKWGAVPDNLKSGYRFQGTSVEAKLDGTDFLLGRFTHYNRVIPMMKHRQFWLYLEVTIWFEDHDFDHVITLRFRHDETPNTNDSSQSADKVILPKVHEDDLVYIPEPEQEGEYKVSITGFLRNGKVMSHFDTLEGGSYSAGLFARFERTSAPIT
jgi:hypothetical protein